MLTAASMCRVAILQHVFWYTRKIDFYFLKPVKRRYTPLETRSGLPALLRLGKLFCIGRAGFSA
ncbi:hypothetical protein [Propionivibrio sp.]|uniref:hypothetical protein n=1 Tax=Propionivibrio sp. TaxID=2212460 RepID=UPI003BF0BCAC